jgi:phage shock protein A
MLDKAEDPEKLIRLMIREMEDTLVDLKASCAGVIAEKKKMERQLAEAHSREDNWENRAEMAVNKGRDDLAREALIEKRRFGQRAEGLEKELSECTALIEQYQDDIQMLEAKLSTARERQRMLVQRHIYADRKRRAHEEVRKIDNSDAILKFEEFENRIERMEAEADLVNLGRKPVLESEFDHLMVDDEIEKELQKLKSSMAGGDEDRRSA